MKYRIEFLPEAQADAEEIRQYLLQFYENTPRKFFALLKTKINNLKSNPYLYSRHKERKSYRKFTVKDYLVFYKVNDEQQIIEIHRIIHGSRDISRYIL